MNRILLVDDDDYKVSSVKLFLEKHTKSNIIVEKALNPGLKRLFKETFDLILLDMSMPTFDIMETNNFNSYGGLEFLKEMSRKKNETPVIIVTQYAIFGEGESKKTLEAIDEECKNLFNNYKGVVLYSSTENSWEEILLQTIGEQDG